MTTTRCATWISLAVAMLVTAGLSVEPSAAEGPRVRFNRDIRPIFSNNCYACHGPDAAQRPTSFRLDTKDGALAELDDGGLAIAPGQSGDSEVFRRISADDPDMRMPPSDSGKQLTTEQIALIRRWIDEGAQWQGHWAFDTPQRPLLPEVEPRSFVRNPIDQFILARLEREGWLPSPQADKTTLIRRVTFDLTGCPPTIAEVDSFLADDSPDAYEKLVDRLLASPRFGEHFARDWLDAARYGDTHGLHLDNERSVWPYREWVIAALNANTPFDRFTVEQLAGDLLPNPTLDQLVATGFNRCNVTTSEGGSIPEEYQVRYAVDRVETTSTVWMGLTLGCAVCHEHKFDPISQKEFYKLFAYFNSLKENPMDGNALLPPPSIKVPNREQAARLEQLDQLIGQLESELKAPMPEVDAAQLAWEQSWSGRLKSQWQVLDPERFVSSEGASLDKLDDKSVLASGYNPEHDTYEVVARTGQTGISAVRLEALRHESLPHGGAGRAENANFVLSEFEIVAVSVADPNNKQPVSFAYAHADHSQENDGYTIEKAIDGVVDGKNGWAVEGDKRREDRTAIFVPLEPFGFDGGTQLQVRMRQKSSSQRHTIGRFRLAVSTDPAFAPAELAAWHVVGPFEAASGDAAYKTAFGPEQSTNLESTYESGTLKWVVRPDLEDGQVNNLEGGTSATYLYRTIDAATPRDATFGIGSNDGVKVWLNDELVLDRNVQRRVKADEDRVNVRLDAGQNRLLMKFVNHGGDFAFAFRRIKEHTGDELLQVAPLLAKPAGERSKEETGRLREYYRRNHSPACRELFARLSEVQADRTELNASIPSSLIMQDMDEPRESYLLVRGEYDKHGEKVEPGVPAALPGLPDDAPPNRLALARWLVSPEHPLTARVTVNRFWQHYYGNGIVKTTEDFGSQGEWPSHPDLLDWLAVEFRESGWDVKHIQRLIVNSSTYRQSSHITDGQYRKDPENRLLGRGPRFRLNAETIRDNALALSGLLVEQVGGPSVRPYQPPGLWEAVAYTASNTAKFKKDEGAALYRRGIYTFWKRTSPPPSMITFDAPSRESCTVRRARTNTPLQALVLMNDEQFVEASRHFAARIMIEGGTSVQERIVFAFRSATSRRPSDDEIAVLQDVYQGHLSEYQQHPDAARKLLGVGDSGRHDSLVISEHAAWTMIANLILNLDETVTKG